MRGLLSIFTGAISKAGGAKAERRTAERLQHVEDDPFDELVKGDRFEPGGCYFSVRLAGLHLVDARRLASEVLPLCVCLADFTYDGQPRSVPFSIGPDVLRQRLSQAGVDAKAAEAKPAWVELNDLRVVKPTPVNVDNLSIYAGLFSVRGNDFVKTLLNVVGNVGSAFGAGAALGPGLKVAETVYDSIGTLLGMNDVEQEVAALNGTALTSSGYLLVAKAPPQTADPGKLRVVKGRLCWPTEGERKGERVIEFDYCLLALEYFKTVIEPASGIAPVLFSEPWKAVMAALGAKQREVAADAYDRLQAAIMTSPDLIEADRVALLGGYLNLYDRYLALKGLKAPDDPTRGTDEVGILQRVDIAAIDLERGGQTALSSRLSQTLIAIDALKEPIEEPAFGSEHATMSAARSVRHNLVGRNLLAQDSRQDAELATALVRSTIGYQPRL
jgi:hypothetical protein